MSLPFRTQLYILVLLLELHFKSLEGIFSLEHVFSFLIFWFISENDFRLFHQDVRLLYYSILSFFFWHFWRSPSVRHGRTAKKKKINFPTNS